MPKRTSLGRKERVRVEPMDSYNGYTPAERSKKLRASYKVFPGRTHPLYQGSCQICGDSSHPVEPLTEDYSESYRWENPADYAVCKVCHGQLHKRFKNPVEWAAYKSHIKRGGYMNRFKLMNV